MSNMCLCYCLGYFVGIMGDFTWRPLVKQVGPVGGIVPPLLLCLLERGVNLLVRLALSLLLRSPPTFFPLFLQRGKQKMLLGRLVIKSQRLI